MARQNYNVNTSEKKIEVFGSFGGGMVTQAHPEKLNDDQSVLIENGELVAGGVVQARGAYQQTNNPSVAISGNTQGRWKYNNLAGGQDIVAINGKLYSVNGNIYTQIVIPNLTQFQASRPIEAVQDRDKMYFATGSDGVVIYDGVNATMMGAYKTNGLEALYVGYNGYSTNPEGNLVDLLTGNANAILGVAVSMRYGVINQNVTFTAYIEKLSADTLEYQWETKLLDSVDYTVAKAWGNNKTYTTSFAKKADYMIRVSLRKTGSTTAAPMPILSQYVVPRYKVNTTPNEKPEPIIDYDDMRLCNRIFIHYDRMFLYGDTGNPDHLYISQLNNFTYFPRTNIIRVSDTLRGTLQAIVRYKNYLVCWTNNSIQMITGKDPQEFEKIPVHTTIGTKFPYSVQIMKNYIAFVGNDNGVYYLKSFSYASDEKLNVERIDDKIKDVVVNLIKTATIVLGTIYNNQYYLYIENGTNKYVYRYYYDYGIWVRDSLSFSIRNFTTIDSSMYATSVTGGIVYTYNQGAFKDDVNTTYTMRLVSKDYDFNLAHHRKKIKMYQLLAKLTNVTTITVKLYADNNLLLATPTTLTVDPLQNSDAQKLKMMASGRFRYMKTDITIPVNELVQLIGFGFIFKESTPK